MGRQYGSDSDKGRRAASIKMQELEAEALFHKKIERIVSAALVIIGIITFICCNISAGSFKKKRLETIDEINKTQSNLSELEKDEESGAGITEVNVVSASAKDAGIDVMNAQNDLNTAIANERASGSELLSDEHQDALKRLRLRFPEDENSRIIRNTWCTLGNWEFNGVFQFEGDLIPVVWKCYEPGDTHKERMLCFVKAMYNSKTDTFEQGDIRYTAWYGTMANEEGLLVEADQIDTATGDEDYTTPENPVENDFNSYNNNENVDYDVESGDFSNDNTVEDNQYGVGD